MQVFRASSSEGTVVTLKWNTKYGAVRAPGKLEQDLKEVRAGPQRGGGTEVQHKAEGGAHSQGRTHSPSSWPCVTDLIQATEIDFFAASHLTGCRNYIWIVL